MTQLSKTSIMVAAGRALGARESDPSVRNPDYLAERLLGPEIRALRVDHPAIQALDRDYDEAMKDPEVFNTVRMMMIRTRFIDARLEHAVQNGATQVVMLGAGFDTRAYRFSKLLENVQVYEVDRPATQAIKMRRVEEEHIDIPHSLNYVPVDFHHDDLRESLERAGYRIMQRTFLICEGVTMYLPEEDVRATLRFVASHAPGSAIVFDFVHRSVITFLSNISLNQIPEPARPAVQRVMQLESGEPWLFGFPDRAEREYLAEFGLEMGELLPIGGDESVRRYLTRRDGSIVGVAPGGPQSAYCLTEATVQ